MGRAWAEEAPGAPDASSSSGALYVVASSRGARVDDGPPDMLIPVVLTVVAALAGLATVVLRPRRDRRRSGQRPGEPETE